MTIAELKGERADAVLFSLHFRTALIETDKNRTLLAQAHYANATWSFDDLDSRVYDTATYSERVDLDLPSGSMLVFDAAYTWEDVGDNAVQFNLAGRLYRVKAALYAPDHATRLTLLRFERLFSRP